MATTPDVTKVRVKSLEQLVERGQVWDRMAEKYGVTNPVPPWKSSLDAMCDVLDKCAAVLPSLTRREEEERLSERQYAELPFPESQLVSLAHSLIARGVIDGETHGSGARPTRILHLIPHGRCDRRISEVELKQVADGSRCSRRSSR